VVNIMSSPSTTLAPTTGEILNRAFIDETLEPEGAGEKFSVVAKRFLRVVVDDSLWVKLGAVIAFHGDFKIRREGVLQARHGIIAREYAPIAKVEGKGTLYCGDEGKRSKILYLSDNTINVVGSALLAFEPSVQHEAGLAGKVGLLAGGLFSFKLSGTGVVVVGTKGDPLTLRVTPDNPVVTDPDCTLAWSGSLKPELKTQLEWRMLVGHGGGEAIQMLFRGDGYVIVHAKEELASKRGLYGTVKTLVKKVNPF
jgi:uncharacterized protein (AIM24 family)